MGRMVRKQIYITPAQDALLKQWARRLGVTESDLIRRGIEQLDWGPTTPLLDEQAWQEEIAFMRERARMVVPQQTGGRGWTREELYDERPKRWCSP